MKGKKLSKVLALLLACAMIFTTLPLMAFANTETYTVSYGSPAILMNESTKVNLNDLLFEMDAAGTTVPGSLITFTAKADDGFAYNPVDKSVIAYGKGTYKLTATYNGIEKTIYVMVKKADETEFVLLDYDFTVDKFVPEEWNLIYYNKHGGTVGTAKATDGTNPAYFIDNSGKANGYVLIGPNNGQETNASGSELWINHGILVNNNPIFKDFADYTVISSLRTRVNLTNEWAGAGVVGRVNLAENGTFDPNISSVIGYLQGNGNMMIESHIGGAWANGTKTYEGSLVNKESTVNNEKYYWHSAVFHTMTTKFDGENIVYNVNNIGNTETIEIFDSSKASSTVQTKWATDGYKAIQPGYPGAIAWDGGCLLQKFTVKLNDNTLAPATELSYYNVSYAAPAILMNENTAVDLDFITVEMDSQGTIATGDKIVWNAAKQENLYLNKDGNKVSVYAAGQYKLTATYNGITKNVWIIAKKADETDFYLANIPELNSKTFVASDWMTYSQDDQTGAAIDSAIGTASGYIQTPADRSFILYNNEIFKDFADYTVEASVDGVTADQETANEFRGSGIVGRIKLDDAGVWDFSGIATYIMQDRRLAVRKNETTRSFAYLGTGIDLTKYDENGDKVYSDDGSKVLNVPELKIWYGNTYHTIKNVFNGSKVEFYFDGEMLYDSTTLTNYPCAAQTTPGYVGVMSHDGRARVKSFSVKLNTNKMPDAIAAETPSDKIDYYNVTDASPAIPMNAFTVLDTKYIAVEFDGQFIPGDQITFALANPTSNVEVAGGKITAYVKGTYKVNATYEGTTKALYAVVKDATDSQFVLYSEEFGDYTNVTTFPNNWKSQWRQDGNSGAYTRYTWGDFESPRVYEAVSSYHQATEAPGIVPFSNTRSWNSAGYFTLSDETVSAFSDYTVIATMAAYSHHNNGTCGAGIFGRANTTADGKLDNKSTLTGVYSATHNSQMLARILESAPGADAASATITRTTIGENWDYTNRNSKTASVTMVAKFAGENVITKINGDDQTFSGTTANTQKGTVGIYAGMIGDNNVSSFVNLREFTVVLNNAADDMPEAETISMYGVSYNDPVIVMHNNTYTNFKKMTVQLTNGGQAYMATDVTWTANTTEGIEVVNGEDGKIVAHANGIYTLTATADGVSKKIYVLVVDKGEDEVVLFSEDFSEKTLDYSVWQQTEYYWGTAYQVTEQKPYSDKYVEGQNISQVGAIPFVTRDYWDALTLGGPRSNESAGGTGYSWNSIFMNNAYYYAYIREDYVTDDGVKLSDFGIYNITMAGETLNPGTNISEYNSSNDTYGGIRMEYNGVGIMGRLDFNGQTYYKKNTSTAQTFMWDGPIKASAGSAKSEASTNINLTNSFGAFSLKAEFRANKLVGRYIPISNAKGYFEVPSYTTEVVATATAGSRGFYTDARDIQIYDFTVSYPITKVVDGVEVEATAENNIVTVPVNATIDLAKYTFSIDGKTVKGNEVAWGGARSAIGELDSYNKTFTGFSVGEVTINGVKFVVTDEAIAGPKSIVDVKGNGALSFSLGSESNVYKVTATAADNSYLLKAGVLTVTYDDGTVKTVPVDNNGVATITTDYIGAIKVAAEFVEKQELGFVSLGATIRLPGTKDAAGNTLKPGIRFGARLNNIRLAEGKAVLDSEITIDGVDYKVAELGSLIIPSRLLNGSELTVNSANAQKKRVTMVSNIAEDHADITAVLVGIPETWYDLDIAFRGYIKYTNLDGTGEYYVYTDEISRTYNGVMKAAPVYDTGAYFDVNNTTVMLTASKANIKYGLGEQMTVFADTYIDGTMANGVKLTYKIYAGDADGYSGAALATGTAYSADNASVKISYTPENAGYYYVVVSAFDTDDNVVITDTIRLGAGIVSANGTNVFDEDNIALNFGVTSDTHIYGEYMNSGNNKNLRDVLKILNNESGYYSDGTQKLDAFLVAGDLTNATAGGSNFNGLPGWATATTKNEFLYLTYAEWNAMRNIINNGLGDAQFIYSMGNHDTQGSARGGYTKVNLNLRTTIYYQQILSGKRVDIVPEVGLGMGTSYDKSVLFDAMTEEAIADLQYDPNDDYTDSKEYIRHYGRDETSGTMFTLGNRKMTINGYTFIVLENTTLQNGFARFTDATMRFLKNALDESVRKDPTAPVFVITHHRPYKTHGDAMGVLDTGSVNIDEILQDYPQAMIWGGHVHDSLQSESTIVQTRTVDENGNVTSTGYTSLSSAACTSNTSGTHGSDAEGGFVQLVQVDVNGNVRITKYSVGAKPDNSDCEVDDAVAEINMSDDGQWVKAWSGDSSPAIQLIQTINNPWFITNAGDDCVRDEYAVDTRAAQLSIGFEAGSATLDGTTLTFNKAINKLGYNNENTTVTWYYAFLFDANGTNIETQVLSTNVAAYAKYTDMPDTYTINFNNTGAYVIIRAYDFWVAYYGTEHERYISNDAQITVYQSQS